MKKIFFCILVLFLVSGFGSTVANANTNNTVVLDGGKIVNNRTLVPLRSIFEELGATVQWDQKTKTVTVTKENTKVWLKIGSKNTQVNGRTVTIDVPAQIVEGKTLVPLRFISESLGAAVNWDSGSQKAMIETSNKTIEVHVLTWKVYENGRFGFKVKYPSHWITGQPPVNGDGLRLYSGVEDDVRATAGFYMPEYYNIDTSNAKKVQIKDGRTAYVTVSQRGDYFSYKMDLIDSGIHYKLYASGMTPFYEENKAILEEMMRSFELIDGLER